MSDYPHTITILDRLTATGLAEHHARRHLRHGHVHLNGETVTDPHQPADPPAIVTLRTTTTTQDHA